jgi:hypothetical protein
MQNINSAFKFDCVDGPISVSIVNLEDLQDTCAAETVQWLGARMLLSSLSHVQREPEGLLHCVWTVFHILAGGGDPMQRLQRLIHAGALYPYGDDGSNGRNGRGAVPLALRSTGMLYGFGMLLATQNPTDIDHKVTGQCATQFFGRAASPNVVAALREAIEERGGSASDLTQLDKGQFYFWSAESHKIPSKVQVPMCLSHHPDGKTLSEAEILDRART